MLRALLMLGLLLAPGALAQEGKKTGEKRKLKFDFRFKYDPMELQEYSRQANRSRRVVGPIWIAPYHIAPGQESGPYLGPPLRIYGTGFGASLWRDPITGRYIQ